LDLNLPQQFKTTSSQDKRAAACLEQGETRFKAKRSRDPNNCYLIAGKYPSARNWTTESAFMNSSTNDKVKGTAKEAVGKVKEETGKAIGNPNLRDRGTAEKVSGKVERKVGDVKKVFGK
jgi:uncharacterized protein YjbJ (UPF0337 family)